MDSYHRSCINIHTIAKDQEWLPTPESWCKWETGPPETMELPDSAAGEFCQEIGNQVGMDSSSHFKDQLPVSDRNLWWDAISSNHSDFQLDNFEGIGRENDLFLNSSSGGYVTNGKFDRSFCFCSGCYMEAWPMDLDHPISPQSLSTELQCLDSSNCSGSHFLSPSVSWGNDAAAEAVQCVPCNSDQEAISPPKILVPCDSNHKKRAYEAVVVEEISLEESVLQDLEMVMSQLTEETRICFRDALYRLADNSRQHQLATESQHLQGSSSMDNSNSPSSLSSENSSRNTTSVSERRATTESETNIIDRIIAKIMFDRVDFASHDFSADVFEHHESLEASEICIDSSEQHDDFEGPHVWME